MGLGGQRRLDGSGVLEWGVIGNIKPHFERHFVTKFYHTNLFLNFNTQLNS